METKIYSFNQLKEVAAYLQAGEVVAFPTETVFGLGVIFDNPAAFAKLVAVKRRPADKPFTLMCADSSDICHYALIDEATQRLINKYMPGPLTIIVHVRPEIPNWVTLGSGMIGIRISSLDLVQELIRLAGKPLLVPSANRAGETPAYNDAEAYNIFAGEIPAIVSGTSVSHVPSTVVIIGPDGPKLIRQGSIDFADIKKIWEEKQ